LFQNNISRNLPSAGDGSRVDRNFGNGRKIFPELPPLFPETDVAFKSCWNIAGVRRARFSDRGIDIEIET
jgi:hypothetical protein